MRMNQILTNNFYWIGGWDELPWVSLNGQTIYFSHQTEMLQEKIQQSATDIYMSILLN